MIDAIGEYLRRLEVVLDLGLQLVVFVRNFNWAGLYNNIRGLFFPPAYPFGVIFSIMAPRQQSRLRAPSVRSNSSRNSSSSSNSWRTIDVRNYFVTLSRGNPVFSRGNPIFDSDSSLSSADSSNSERSINASVMIGSASSRADSFVSITDVTISSIVETGATPKISQSQCTLNNKKSTGTQLCSPSLSRGNLSDASSSSLDSIRPVFRTPLLVKGTKHPGDCYFLTSFAC